MSAAPDHRFWSACEGWSRDQLEAYQLEALRRQLGYVGAHSPFYARRFEEIGWTVSDLRHLHDIRALPITRKSDYAAAVDAEKPWGTFMAAPIEDVRRVHFSSGTTARPTPQFWTEGDLEQWADLYARYAYGHGVGPGDLFQCLFTFTWFVGGLGAMNGYQRVGATCIPAGGQESERQIRAIFEFGTTVVCGTPSFILHLADVARGMGLDPAGSKVRCVVVGGEPGGSVQATRKRIESAWGAKCYDAYGSLEFQPIGWDCGERSGPHLAEDFVYSEVLDPDSEGPVADGEPGVLVLTHLTKQAGPLVRWWTGDIVVRTSEPCRCGRTHSRLLNGVRGRADDMIVVRGVNLFPSAVEAVVRAEPGLGGEYQIVIDKSVRDAESGFVDAIRLRVEALEGTDPDVLSERLGAEVKAKLHVRALVEVLPMGTLPRTTHKATRVMRGDGAK